MSDDLYKLYKESFSPDEAQHWLNRMKRAPRDAIGSVPVPQETIISPEEDLRYLCEREAEITPVSLIVGDEKQIYRNWGSALKAIKESRNGLRPGICYYINGYYGKRKDYMT